MRQVYEYDLCFQEYLLASLVTDAEFLKKHREVIKPEYFDDETLSAIAETSLEFFDANGTCPDIGALVEGLATKVAPGRKLGEYRERAKHVLAKVGTSTEFYRAKACDFARRQAVLGAIKDSELLVRTGEYEDVVEIFKKAVEVGRDNGTTQDFFSQILDRAKSYKKAGKEGNSAIRDGVVSTGIEELNEVCNGGLGAGELGFIVAPPKHGKSTMLVNLGAAAVWNGKKVLHVTLELRERMLAAKYDSRFFGESMRDIQKRPKKFYRAMKAMKEQLTGSLIIKEFPTKGLKVRELKRLAGDIEGLGMVIIDYADLLGAGSRRDELRHELGETYEALRGMAGELGVPVWTASQASRGAIGQRVIGMEYVAESSQKIATADVAFSMCQTIEESKSGKMRLYVMGSRIGPSEVECECVVNWATATIRSANEV